MMNFARDAAHRPIRPAAPATDVENANPAPRSPWVRGARHAVPVLAGVLVVLLALQLGNWQLRRAAEKTELQARIESAQQRAPAPLAAGRDAAEWQAVALRGRWHAEGTIYLDNRVHQGRAGYHVLTPLERDGGGWVLVSRGWTAAGADRAVLPDIATQAGPVEIEGTARHPEQGAFTLAGQPAQGQLWQYLDLEAYRAATGLPVAGWIVQQNAGPPDGLVRDWPRPDAGIDRHRGYALQWFSLGALAFVLSALYLFRSFRRDVA